MTMNIRKTVKGKRAAVIAMALVLSLSALTGCGGKKQENTGSKTPTAQSQSVNPANQAAANAKKNEAGNQNSAGKKNNTADIPRINVGSNANTKPDDAKTDTSTTAPASKSGSNNG